MTFKFFSYIIYFMLGTCVIVHMWKSEDNLNYLSPLNHDVGPKDWTKQDIRFGSMCLYPQIHPQPNISDQTSFFSQGKQNTPLSIYSKTSSFM